jgi:hypothetical protein
METVLAPIILFIIFTTAVYFFLAPLLTEKIIDSAEDVSAQVAALELRKVNLYKQLREVEFEREMGLADEEDYVRTQNDLMSEVAQVIQQLEGPSIAPEDNVDSAGQSVRVTPREDIATDKPVPRFCTQCGAPVRPDDRFCGHCGRGLLN